MWAHRGISFRGLGWRARNGDRVPARGGHHVLLWLATAGVAWLGACRVARAVKAIVYGPWWARKAGELCDPSPVVYNPRRGRVAGHSHNTAVFPLAKAAIGGSRKTIGVARCLKKPCLHISMDASGDAVRQLRGFIFRNGIRAPNVAGSRGAKGPGVGARVGRCRAWNLDGMVGAAIAFSPCH